MNCKLVKKRMAALFLIGQANHMQGCLLVPRFLLAVSNSEFTIWIRNLCVPRGRGGRVNREGGRMWRGMSGTTLIGRKGIEKQHKRPRRPRPPLLPCGGRGE